MSQTGFFTALLGSCSGVAVFRNLKENSWFRVIVHFLVLAAIVSAAAAWGEFLRFNRALTEAADSFEIGFGALVCGPAGIAPRLRPQEARSLTLPHGGRLEYLPHWENGVKFPASDLGVFNYLIFWTPARLVIAANSGEELGWQVVSQQTGSQKIDGSLMKSSELSEFLARPFLMKAKKTVPETVLPIPPLVRLFQMGTLLLLFLGKFLNILLDAFLYVLIFTLVFRLTGGAKKLQSMTLRQFAKVGIYAGFPAMIVAGFFPMLALPFFSFNTIYMIGMVIYWLIAVNRLESEFRQQQGGDFNG